MRRQFSEEILDVSVVHGQTYSKFFPEMNMVVGEVLVCCRKRQTPLLVGITCDIASGCIAET